MKKLAIICAGLLVVSAPQAPAQAFSGFTANSDGAEFWDNLSNDGTMCNSGFIVTGVAPTSCANQRPNTWLPYSGTPATTYLNASGAWAPIAFGTGAYTLQLLGGTPSTRCTSPCLGGDVAGANLDWGLFQIGNRSNRTSLNGTGALPFSNTFGYSWGLWVDLLSGGRAYSDTDSQFALFGFGRVDPNTWIAGIEDNASRSSGDFDYQDMMFRITSDDTGGGPQNVVPEPATMTLLATGLAGMAAAGRRRRKQK